MKGKDFFKNKYGEFFEFFFLKYFSGTGTLKVPSGSMDIEWEIIVDLKGEHRIFLTSKARIPFEPSDRFFPEFFLEGISSDKKFKIVAKDCYFYNSKLSLSANENNFFYEGQSRTIIEIALNENFKVKKVCSYIRNLSIPKEINFLFKSKNYTLSDYKYSSKFIELIRNDYIAYAPLSVLVSNSDGIFSISNYLCELEIIESLLSLQALNFCLAPFSMLIGENDDPVGYIIENKIAYQYVNFSVINEEQCGGLANFISLIEKNVIAHYDLDFKKVVQFTAKIVTEKELEIKWAVLIMAFEFFANFYFLKFTSLTKTEIESFKNIQQKLDKLNFYLRFIPKEYLSDILRDKIRNPLFHSGEIPFYDFKKLDSLFEEYLDLYIRIVFRTFGYNGKILSPMIGFEPKDV